MILLLLDDLGYWWLLIIWYSILQHEWFIMKSLISHLIVFGSCNRTHCARIWYDDEIATRSCQFGHLNIIFICKYKMFNGFDYWIWIWVNTNCNYTSIWWSCHQTIVNSYYLVLVILIKLSVNHILVSHLPAWYPMIQMSDYFNLHDHTKI